MKKRILIACEESQAVCWEFRKLGFNAFSCDILESSGPCPKYHIQQDVSLLLSSEWDLIIAFPPCTYLTVTANSWYNIEKYGAKAQLRLEKREEAIKFFMMFINANCKRIAVENPIGIMSTRYRKPDQIIQPYYFGDPFEKRTCLWLKGLPKLEANNIVEPEKRIVSKSGKTMAPWFAKCWGLPEEERRKIRSKTFPGIAKAMAVQWGNFLNEQK